MGVRSFVGLEPLLRALRVVYLSRFADEKMAKLVKQSKGGTFQLSSGGHELIGAVCSAHLLPGKDWALPYYRDLPFVLGLGTSLLEIFGTFLGRATAHHSSGRMMPYHYSDKQLRIFCQSSVVGSQFLHAAGRGLGIRNLGRDELVYVSAGEGATSQGDFHEALNFTAIHRLPVIFVIQNNGWAISVPVEEQSAGGSLASVIRGYAGMELFEVDGTDYLALNEAMERAAARGRRGEGPSVLFAHVPRLGAHSNSDDPKKYKSKEKETEEVLRDPRTILERFALEQGVEEATLSALKAELFEEVERAADAADALAYPSKGSSRQHLFSQNLPPAGLTESAPSSGEKIVMVDALNHALDEEMALDPHVVVFGQDVAHGKGGVFGVTRQLTERFGVQRCFNTPLAESTIIGVAIGLSMDGLHKPVAEIQFADYIWTGINQLFNEAASIHYRSNGEWEVPIVVRAPYGGYIQGGPYHSQSIEGFLAHCPGLKVVVPSHAADAKGLLKMAIRDPNPVVFLEHKGLYRQQKFCARSEPSSNYLLPFGQAAVVREGRDVTVVAWGMLVVMAWEVAERLASEGISVEVIDLRTLVPLDTATVVESVRKTNKLLVAHEAPLFCGFGAEVAARLSEEAFSFLDAPVQRLGGFECAVPYSKPLENEVLPQLADVESAIRRLLRY